MNIDELTGLELKIKTPGEFVPFSFVFSDLLAGELITSVTSVTQVKRGSVTISVDTLISNLSHNNTDTGQAWVSAGTQGEYYCLTMKVLTSLSAIREKSLIIYIKDPC